MVIDSGSGHGVDRRLDRAARAGSGRKPLLLIGFGALPLRAVLFVLAPGPWWVVAAQATGGLTAAVIGIMTPPSSAT